MNLWWTLGTYLVAIAVGAYCGYRFELGTTEKLQIVIDAGVEQHKAEVAAAQTSEAQHETDLRNLADVYTASVRNAGGVTCTVHAAQVPARPAVSGAEPARPVEQPQAVASSFDESSVLAILKQGDECIATLNNAKIWAKGLAKATGK